MSQRPAVLVRDVHKSFALPQEKVHTLKERALHPLRRTRFDVLRALQGVSFAVAPGEFFGIVGRNGSGKSTLLKCLAGIYRADRGDIYVDGRMSTFIELGVGFNPDLAARDNAMLNAIMMGLSKREADERYDRILDFAELREFEDLKIKNYSSGMLVRLAFSVMIQVDADILLIDEVLAVGDASFQQKCYDEFNRLRDEGRTILFVTHDMGSVERFCDRAMLLERGEMKLLGAPSEVAAEYFELNFGRGAPQGEAEPTEPQRTGDRRAEVLDCWFEDEHGERTDTLRQRRGAAVATAIRFREDLEDPSFSVALETAEHVMAFVASSSWEQERTGSFRAGETVVFRVSFENPLAPGRYYATPSVARRGSGADVHDRVPLMQSVVVTGSRPGGGIVDLPHEVSIERIGATTTEEML